MKKAVNFILGCCTYIVIIFILTAYGNIKVHPNINAEIINTFKSNFTSSLVPLDKFMNYNFSFYMGGMLRGTEVSKASYIFKYLEESTAEKTASNWIIHGGFSADEPEIYASVRHFYDPTQPEGERYLKNLITKLRLDDPKIDHLNLALDHTEHLYNWKNGKAHFANALMSSDEDFRNEELAFAYRALGETLHMIADMGCPAHVRDDAHPAMTNITQYDFGSNDMYEEYIENYVDLPKHFGDGKVDENLKSTFRSAETMKEIAHTLAVYTNTNFFTCQTISGNGIQPVTHPEKVYPSPKLDECKYDEMRCTYSKTISGSEVLMCKDLFFSLGFTDVKKYPYIDKACVLSMGKVIIPQILEAGANVYRLFIPSMEVVINNYDEDNKLLTGEVIHNADKEYDFPIKYNGKVTILNSSTFKPITDVECVDGKINASIKTQDFKNVDWEQNGIQAKIKFGDIEVISEAFKGKKVSNKPIKVKHVSISASVHSLIYSSKKRASAGFNDETKEYETEMLLGFETSEIVQSGNIITGSLIETDINNRETRSEFKVTMDLNNTKMPILVELKEDFYSFEEVLSRSFKSIENVFEDQDYYINAIEYGYGEFELSANFTTFKNATKIPFAEANMSVIPNNPSDWEYYSVELKKILPSRNSIYLKISYDE